MEIPTSSRYEILRPCLWFAKGEMVPVRVFQSYYTAKAIRSLIEYDYIKIHL